MKERCNKTIRIENFNVTEEVYNQLMKLKEESGMTMKMLITLIVNTCANEIEFDFVKEKKKIIKEKSK